MVIAKSLNRAYESTQKEIDLNDSTKIILFSDLHRGVGDWSDDFAYNKLIFSYALQHYFDQGYTYIEIGDGDELWENKNFEDIKRIYSNIFELMSKFYKEKRLHLIWGNHNRYWKKDKNVRKHLRVLVDDIKLFDDIKKVDEGVKLGDKIFIVHGHQVQPLCDHWLGRGISRFLVRNIWKLLQNVFGFKDPTSPAKNFKTRNKVDKKILNWAKEKNLLVIAGHTHRPMFYSLSKEDRIQNKTGEPYYFNVGSCVHPRCITGIEIENGDIRLVKWFIDVKKKALPKEIEHKQGGYTLSTDIKNDGSLFVNSKEKN
jgi:UDP-2,3-diacylglucosamine pyrophosphatase LpxH